jgi:hypothetical protein
VRAWPAIRAALILSPPLALIAAATLFVARQYRDTPPLSPDAGGRLVVVVVFDQMRGDYVTRWAPLFGTDGFERVKREGVWYSETRIPYAVSTTGPGHATIGTGRPPRSHGIVDNAWVDLATNKVVYCATGTRPHERVPPGPGGGQSPERMLAPTVGDTLATSGRGRVLSLALKDRAAVMMGGVTPTGCYWFDGSGEFVTSDYYRERLPPWAARFNAGKPADAARQQPWDRLLALQVYADHAGADDAPGEPKPAVFPHAIPANDALFASPAGNEMLWDFARAALDGEGLGRSGGTDLLMLGFSANDLVGHAYGPDSQEVLDITLRSDKLLAAILAELTTRFGPDRFTLILTADHGVCPLPEHARADHPDAARFDALAVYGPLAVALDDAFGRSPGGAGWVEHLTFPWMYLNQRRIAAQGLDRSAVQAYAAQWCANHPDVAATAFPRDLLAGPPAADPLLRAAQLSYRPDRCGDLYLLQKPYAIPRGLTGTGTTHGTPYPYDTHVPLMAIGHGVPKLGEQPTRVSSLTTARLTAHCLGLDDLPLPEPLPAGWAK